MGKKYIYDRTRRIVRHYTVKNCDPMTGPLKELIVLAANSAGYSRLMDDDDAATVRHLKGHQAVMLPLIDRYGGRLIDTAGDGILAEFPSVIGAVECAVEMQTVMAARNAEIPEPRRPLFRLGINLGDVMYDETRIYGDGINVAARGDRRPGGICISRQVFDQVNRGLKLDFQALGPRSFKNIAQPVDVFAVAVAHRAARPGTPSSRPSTYNRRFASAARPMESSWPTQWSVRGRRW